MDGRIVRMEIATDITERKQAEEEIMKSSREWRAAMDALAKIRAPAQIRLMVTRSKAASTGWLSGGRAGGFGGCRPRGALRRIDGRARGGATGDVEGGQAA